MNSFKQNKMPTKEYYCSVCNYKNDRKLCVKQHINRKNKCGENPIILTRDIVISCEYCGNNFSSSRGLKVHIKQSCKVLKSDREAKLEQENKELREKLASKSEANKVLKTFPIEKLSSESKGKIRTQARKIYESSKFNMVCLHCEHDRGVQVCHIRELSSFNEGDSSEEINHISNLIGLCANCHYDLDKMRDPDVTRTTEIYKRLVWNQAIKIRSLE